MASCFCQILFSQPPSFDHKIVLPSAGYWTALVGCEVAKSSQHPIQNPVHDGWDPRRWIYIYIHVCKHHIGAFESFASLPLHHHHQHQNQQQWSRCFHWNPLIQTPTTPCRFEGTSISKYIIELNRVTWPWKRKKKSWLPFFALGPRSGILEPFARSFPHSSAYVDGYRGQ